LVAMPQMTYLYDSGFPVVVDVYETTSVKSAAKGVSTMAPVYAEEVSVNLASASIVPGLGPCVPQAAASLPGLSGGICKRCALQRDYVVARSTAGCPSEVMLSIRCHSLL
jgi:hypothetical protein